MCIAFFTLGQPGYKLILASNRDEYLARPTLSAEWHDFDPSPRSSVVIGEDGVESESGRKGRVLSGRDRGKAAGGTWLGMSRDLKVGLLTNIRLIPPASHIAPAAQPPSRGLLLKQFLTPNLDDTLRPPPLLTNGNRNSDGHSNGEVSPKTAHDVGVHDYLQSHFGSAGEYEGFNLLLFSLGGEKPEVGYLTNRPEPSMTDLHIPPAARPVNGYGRSDSTPGESNATMPVQCYGVSNSPMFQPWEKVTKGEERMQSSLREWVEHDESDKELVERMFGVLRQSIPITHDDDMLRSTTIPPVLLQNDVFVGADANHPSTQWKGTRTSTVIIVKDTGEAIFVERDIAELDEDGQPREGKGERWFEFVGETHSWSSKE